MTREFTDQELAALPLGSTFVYDVEIYPNYFLVTFMDIVTDRYVTFEQSPDRELELDKLRWLIWRYCIVGFNSINYDLPMVLLALNGFNTAQLKEASNAVIFEGLRGRELQERYKFILPPINHIDLMEVAPLRGSLKIYGGRLHCPTIRELPYPHNTWLTREEAANVREYNINDLDVTKLLLVELFPHIELRVGLGKEYGRDFRSLSDAQVAEAIISNRIYRKTGHWPKKNKAPPKHCYYYPPSYMQFQTAPLQRALEAVTSSQFEIGSNGSAIIPEKVTKLALQIGHTSYKMGIGGLHSQEKSIAYKAGNGVLLIDRDVNSYYPAIILNLGLFPQHLGPIFLEIYKWIVDTRLRAKKEGNKKTAEGLKIASNGTFGKLGNLYSVLYAPDLLLQVTLTGQLSLLLLIEMLELAGLEVVSGNTDGIVVRLQESRYNEFLGIVQIWEKRTGFTTEETRYSAIYSRDVNNYFAVKDLTQETVSDAEKRNKSRFLDERLGIKVKGSYCERGSAQNSVLSKNPENLVCSDAVIRLIRDGVPVEDTIRACPDIRRFVTVRNVKTGGSKDDEHLGKVVRWYYARATVGAIRYNGSGNKVPESDGAKPLMVLPDTLPSDLDYGRYISEAKKILTEIGYTPKPRIVTFF